MTIESIFNALQKLNKNLKNKKIQLKYDFKMI
jgi:hypothetical protein